MSRRTRGGPATGWQQCKARDSRDHDQTPEDRVVTAEGVERDAGADWSRSLSQRGREGEHAGDARVMRSAVEVSDKSRSHQCHTALGRAEEGHEDDDAD